MLGGVEVSKHGGVSDGQTDELLVGVGGNLELVDNLADGVDGVHGLGRSLDIPIRRRHGDDKMLR